ncbi:hypothetical protein KUA24_155 [Vibrio phage HNL01]|nr:hypothetical protein KUA24_155 [Vibrio phage HNL01]
MNQLLDLDFTDTTFSDEELITLCQHEDLEYFSIGTESL